MRQRWQKFYEWWSLTRVLGALALVFGFVFLVIEPPISRFLSDIAPEFFGIGVTVLLIDWANERRSIAEEKAALILQMGSPDRTLALEAVRILRRKGWLEDGSLIGARLQNCVLPKADLSFADLSRADFFQANLYRAILSRAILKNTWIIDANLQFSIIIDANLKNADLRHSNFHQATLIGCQLQKSNLQNANLLKSNLVAADLRGANLNKAILKHAQFSSAVVVHNVPPRFDESTILPDGTYWTPERDLREFTHPEEWAAEQAKKRFTFSKPPGFARDSYESKS